VLEHFGAFFEKKKVLEIKHNSGQMKVKRTTFRLLLITLLTKKQTKIFVFSRPKNQNEPNCSGRLLLDERT